MYGIGLNSIRWRFALASVVLTVIGVLVRDKAWHVDAAQGFSWVYAGSVLGLALAIGAITFCMASKLTNLIESLRRSTEAIAEGAVDSPVDVDCACEIGGLAHSFRKMTGRLNANLVRINALAYTDPITSLPNRSVIDHLLDYTLTLQRDTTFQGAIVFINLDNFKRINDTFGHEGGDELLRQAAQRMLTQGLDRSLETLDTCMDSSGSPCQRLPEDIVFARFASDEFVAIVPGLTRREELTVLAEKLLSAMQEPFRIKSQEVVIGISMGITVTPHDSRQAAELLNFADLAMNSAKRAGKSRFHFFDQSLRDLILERARIEADLRRALQGNELLLHYQPKIDTETLAMVGVEALVRWQHPERGLLMPGTFIDVAEQVGLMTQLGERVIALAVAQCRAWLDEGISRTVAVNVSPSQFIDPAFVPGVLAMLHDARVPPHLLSIEITESIAMTDIDDTAERLNALRAAGVRIAIDDFGIGFSNLSQLSRLPVDDLKIDRSLVMEIGSSPRSEVIIRAIIGMTHALGYKTIAEGIETQEQLAFLQAQGCDCVQGFLFGRPMSVQQLERWNLGRVQHTLPLRTLSA